MAPHAQVAGEALSEACQVHSAFPPIMVLVSRDMLTACRAASCGYVSSVMYRDAFSLDVRHVYNVFISA